MSSEAPRTKAIAAIVVVLAFLAGAVVGVIGDHVWMFRHGRGPSHASLRFAKDRILAHLDRELHFTPEQRKAVDQILERRTERIRALWNSVQPQIHSEIDQTDAEIEKVLTAEQKTKYAELRKRMRKRHPL